MDNGRVVEVDKVEVRGRGIFIDIEASRRSHGVATLLSTKSSKKKTMIMEWEVFLWTSKLEKLPLSETSV